MATENNSGGMFRSIGSLFRPTQQVSQVQQPQPQPQQQQVNNGPGSSMQLLNDPLQQQKQDSPLDAFTDLWKNDPNGQQTNVDPFSQPLFQTDPQKIMEAASKQNFTANIPPELMQKVLAGNDPQALVEVINNVAQQSLALSLQLQTATTEQAGSRIGQRFNQAFGDKFKEHTLRSTKPDNPALNHPAAAPMLEMLRERMRVKNPDKSAAEINQMAEQYFTEWAGMFGSGNKQEANTNAADPSDFSTWA